MNNTYGDKLIKRHLEVGGNITPTASGSSDIGSVSFAFDDAYIDKVHLKSNPTLPLQAATKEYVDTAVLGENLWDRTGTVLSPHTAGDRISVAPDTDTNHVLGRAVIGYGMGSDCATFCHYDRGSGLTDFGFSQNSTGNSYMGGVDDIGIYVGGQAYIVANLINNILLNFPTLINVNSTSALKVEQAGVHNNVLSVDTTNGTVYIGTTGSTTYGVLNIVQNTVGAPSWVRGIEIVHPLGTGTGIGGYLGISMVDVNKAAIQVGDDTTNGNLLLQMLGGNVGIGLTAIPLATLEVGGTVMASGVVDHALTSGRVILAGAAGVLSDSASLTFNGTTLTTPDIHTTNGQIVTAPAANLDIANKEYVDLVAQGLSWQEPAESFWDASAGLPVGPALDVRYICLVSGTGWTINRIYQYNGATWDEQIPEEAWALWVNLEDTDYVFNGTAWVKFAATLTHNNLSGIYGTSPYYHLSADEFNGFWGPKFLTAASGVFGGMSTMSIAASGQIDMIGNKIINMADPTRNQDAATKKYVDDSVLAENLWDRTGTTLVPHTSGDTVAYDKADWTGGNVVYCPLSGNIQTYINACSAGDVLQLSAGTYTITSGLTIDRKIHLRGCGEGITTITCATDLVSGNMLAFTTTDGSKLSNMTIGYTAASTDSTIITGWDVSGLISNVQFIDSSTGVSSRLPYAIRVTTAGKTVDIENCTHTGSGSSGMHLFVGITSVGATANIRNCSSTTTGGVNTLYGNNMLLTNNATAYINAYNSTFIADSNAVATKGGIYCLSGNISLYNCVVSAPGATSFDVLQTDGTLTLYDTTLVNNTISGTITYAGTVKTEGISVSDLTATSIVYAGTSGLLTDSGLLTFDGTRLSNTDYIKFNDTDNTTQIGYQAGKNIVAGAKYNTFVGYQAGISSIVGGTNAADDNTGIGYGALFSNSIGKNNTALGSSAASFNNTGSENTAIGKDALNRNITGSGNIAIGYYAGHYELGSSSFYVDNQDRTNTAGDKAGALLYGTFNATPASQTLRVNGVLSALPDTDTTHIFGRAKIGIAADYATFSHYDCASYNLAISSTNEVYLKGHPIYFYSGAALGTLTNTFAETLNTFAVPTKINTNSTTALLVEQDGVKDNTLVVDTTNGYVGIGCTPATALDIDSNSNTQCLRLRGADAANEYLDMYVQAGDIATFGTKDLDKQVYIASGNVSTANLAAGGQVLAMNLINNAKFELIEDINQLVGTANIKGFWIFDQTGATTSITDRSPNAHTLTLGGNASTLSPAVAGLCPNLTFADAAATAWLVTDNADFTPGATGMTVITLWNPTSMAALAVSKSAASNYEWELMSSGGNTYFVIYNPAVSKYNYVSVADYADTGTWHCYAGTSNGNTEAATLNLYRDGAVVSGATTNVGGAFTVTDGTADMRSFYGTNYSRAKYGIVIYIDKALTAAEVSRLSKRLLAYAGLFQ